jgi:mRNA interferase HigB
MGYFLVVKVRNEKVLVTYQSNHADIRKPLTNWKNIIENSIFHNFDELHKTFSRVDRIANTNFISLTIFIIKGNTYRLIVDIDYTKQIVLVESIMTHAEYDKVNWNKYGG